MGEVDFSTSQSEVHNLGWIWNFGGDSRKQNRGPVLHMQTGLMAQKKNLPSGSASQGVGQFD